jgi:hypothetical protein
MYYCQVCPKLKAAYEDSVRVYKEAVVLTNGAIADDALTGPRAMVALHDRAMDAHRELLAHLKAEHWGAVRTDKQQS